MSANEHTEKLRKIREEYKRRIGLTTEEESLAAQAVEKEKKRQAAQRAKEVKATKAAAFDPSTLRRSARAESSKVCYTEDMSGSKRKAATLRDHDEVHPANQQQTALPINMVASGSESDEDDEAAPGPAHAAPSLPTPAPDLTSAALQELHGVVEGNMKGNSPYYNFLGKHLGASFSSSSSSFDIIKKTQALKQAGVEVHTLAEPELVEVLGSSAAAVTEMLGATGYEAHKVQRTFQKYYDDDKRTHHPLDLQPLPPRKKGRYHAGIVVIDGSTPPVTVKKTTTAATAPPSAAGSKQEEWKKPARADADVVGYVRAEFCLEIAGLQKMPQVINKRQRIEALIEKHGGAQALAGRLATKTDAITWIKHLLATQLKLARQRVTGVTVVAKKAAAQAAATTGATGGKTVGLEGLRWAAAVLQHGTGLKVGDVVALLGATEISKEYDMPLQERVFGIGIIKNLTGRGLDEVVLITKNPSKVPALGGITTTQWERDIYLPGFEEGGTFAKKIHPVSGAGTKVCWPTVGLVTSYGGAEVRQLATEWGALTETIDFLVQKIMKAHTAAVQ